MKGVVVSPAKLDLAIRCAKAGLLLSSLKRVVVVKDEQAVPPGEEVETMMREIRDLRLKLARERFRSSRIELCGSMELAITVALLVMSLAALTLFKLVAL
ncbi:hypothetical protein LINGRAHAP2_LOCUS28933 [Linum grandiflorum]